MMNKIKIFFLFGFLALAAACSPYKNIHKINISELYKPNALDLHPQYKCWHKNDSVTTVFYQVNLSELVYKKNIKTDNHIAKYKIEYILFQDYSAKVILDSNSIVLYDSLYYGKDRSSIGFFDIKAQASKNYVLKLSLYDLNSVHKTTYYKELEKENIFTRQNFYLKATDGLPILTDYVSNENEFRIIYNQADVKKLQVKYFKPKYPAAAPPYVGKYQKAIRVKADSVFYIDIKDGVSDVLQLKEQGMYHFQNGNASQSGFTLFRYTNNYPYLKTDMQTLFPLRYISTGKEFKEMIESEDKELAVYSFWKEILGGSENVKEVSNLYYYRVQQANILFNSDREGWKTDRGMIYIVYGEPDYVYRDKFKETWVYSNNNRDARVTFDFDRSASPFSDNDYWLNRRPNYKYSWNKNVEFWRRY